MRIAELLQHNGLLDKEKYSDTVVLTQELLGETLPYTTVNTIIQGKPQVIFKDHFIEVFRQALSTGCMARMSYEEEVLLYAFIKYQNMLLEYINVYDIVDMRFDSDHIKKFMETHNLIDDSSGTATSKIATWLEDNQALVSQFQAITDILKDSNTTTYLNIQLPEDVDNNTLAYTLNCSSDYEVQELLNTVQDYVEAYIYKNLLSSDLHVIQQLEAWLNDELACKPHPQLNECFDATHSWNSCS
jgi:hypothetical protein